MKIYTKTGDTGKTQHKSGRIYKNDPKVHIVGILDELHAHMTMIHPISTRDQIEAQKMNVNTLIFYIIREQALAIQCELIDLGSFFSGYSDIVPKPETLENNIDTFDKNLKPLKNFIIPMPRFEIESTIHICRSVARKLERHLIDEVDSLAEAIPYVNRLSDYFFTVGRVISNLTGDEYAVHLVDGRHRLIE